MEVVVTGVVGAMRGSKGRSGPALTFTPAAWTAFIAATKATGTNV